RHHVAEGMTVAERLRDRSWLTGTLTRSEWVSRIEGDWQAARESIDRGLALSPMDARLLCVGGLLEYQAGDFEQGEAYLERFLEALRSVAVGPSSEYGFAAGLMPLIGRITGSPYRSEIAESAAQAVLSSAFATPLVTLHTRTGLVLLAVERGDVAAAQEQYAALKPLQGIVVPQFLVSVDRLLGLLAHTMGNIDQAAEHSEDALAFCRKAGYRTELAWACCDDADTLLQRDNPGDRERAMSLLDESLAISTELGMRPLMERVLSRRDILRA
ncbi:MAG: tetratricopeptide repeat protein, partial [Dehalococcoidia bacterium]